MLIERKWNQLVQKIVSPPVVRFRRLMRIAGGLYLVGAILPAMIPGINYGKIVAPVSNVTVPLGTPLTGDIVLFLTAGEALSPIQAGMTADGPRETAFAVGGDIAFGILAPPMLIVGTIVGAVLMVLPLVLGWLLLRGWDAYLRGIGFSYLMPFGIYTFALSVNGVGFELGLGSLALIVASTLAVIAGLDRAKGWGLIANNYVGADRSRTTGEYLYEGKMSKDEYLNND
jgi:hypothetical protein